MEDLMYLCRFYDNDNMQSISLALERTQQTIANKVKEMKQNGLFTHYRNLYKKWYENY